MASTRQHDNATHSSSQGTQLEYVALYSTSSIMKIFH